MKQLPILSILLLLGMFAACSTIPSGTTQSDIKKTTTPPEVIAKAPQPAPENKPAPENRDSDNTYHNAELGFSITKPSNWLYTNPELIKARAEKARLADKDLEELIKKKQIPRVVITRYPSAIFTLNPNVVIKVAAMPAEVVPLKNIMNLSLAMIKRSLSDLTFVDEIQDAEVDGIKGAYSKFKYTLSVKGRKHLIMARMWLVSRGRIMFTIVMTGPHDGPDVSEEAFEKILSSIKIARSPITL